jgi:ribonucleoside-diphosphate reductase alpha chain
VVVIYNGEAYLKENKRVVVVEFFALKKGSTMEMVKARGVRHDGLVSGMVHDGAQDAGYKGTIAPGTLVAKRNGSVELLDHLHWHEDIAWASKGHEASVSPTLIIDETIKNVFSGISTQEVEDALILATVCLIERDPAYGYVAAQLLLKKLFKSVTSQSIAQAQWQEVYKATLRTSIERGVHHAIISKDMLTYDLDYLAEHMRPERDRLFDYMGLKTLYERYFTKYEHQRFELPQAFWMRVAMGLALNEPNKNERALEFYNLISTFKYIPGTPTLLHAGQVVPQLSSCYLNTVEDDLKHIFKCLGDNAQMSKWSGGIGTDWTNIRATGAMVKSIKTDSQGLIPFLKISNDVTAAINRSGSRRAAACVYLETWHMDIEDFLDLRKNTGDERRRAHDINTANWIPDLFIKRVIADQDWTLFSPDEVPELHHIYGRAFEAKYVEYEEKARRGELKKYAVVSATKLWRKMLSRLFETGHPWLTFKDPCNVRSPQDHVGVIHNSNLCTEITLNTSDTETAVCNLGSINIGLHIVDGVLDKNTLASSIRSAIRMLDNVIDINFYPTPEAQTSNVRHRPIGLGVMGLQDAFYKLDIAFDDPQSLEVADALMEEIAYNAILASSELAQERGAYSSYKGSKWDRGLFPQDTIALLEHERGMPIQCSKTGKLDWTPVRQQVRKYGMRNSNTMAIAPTATISNIAGCIPCIEPIYKNIYVKANMSGEFTVVNKYLVEDLKKLNLWNADMLDQLKYYDGNVAKIASIPQRLKDKYKEAFQVDPEWLIQLTAARGKWIDQSQSHNVFMSGVSGSKLSAIYIAAWKAGLKTTYYLRTLGASQIEKSTLDASKFGFTQKREYAEQTKATLANVVVSEEDLGKACSLENPECESCQ